MRLTPLLIYVLLPMETLKAQDKPTRIYYHDSMAVEYNRWVFKGKFIEPYKCKITNSLAEGNFSHFATGPSMLLKQSTFLSNLFVLGHNGSTSYLNSIKCTYSGELTLINGSVFHSSSNSIYENLHYESCSFQSLSFQSDTINNIRFTNCTIDDYVLDFLKKTKINGSLELKECLLENYLSLTDIHIEGDIFIDRPKNGTKFKILIDDKFPVYKLKASPSTYQLYFDNVRPGRIESIYREIVESQKKFGSSRDIEEADIALKDHLASRGDIFLKFQKFLWMYGYDKRLLLKRFLSSFLFFYLINIFLFRILITEVYPIKNLRSAYENLSLFKYRKVKYTKYPLIVFIYCCIIFLGWKMDLDKLEYKHLWLSLYLLTFYLIGLGLLFYVAGLVLYR